MRLDILCFVSLMFVAISISGLTTGSNLSYVQDQAEEAPQAEEANPLLPAE